MSLSESTVRLGRTATQPRTYGTPLPAHPTRRLDVLTRPGALVGVHAYQAPAERRPMPSAADRDAAAEHAITGGWTQAPRRNRRTGKPMPAIHRTCPGCMTVMPANGVCDWC